MLMTLELPPELVQTLQDRATQQERSVDELVTDLLQTAVQPNNRSLEEVVARIQAMPPNPAMIHPAEGSLAEALASLSPDPDFNFEEWQEEWNKVEAEMKAREIADMERTLQQMMKLND